MSSISGTGQALYQFLQSISAEAPAQKGTASVAPEAATTPATESGADQAVQGAQHHHHRGHGHGALFEKLGEAILSALQSAQSNGSSEVDPNQVIEDTITKFLQDNNITLPGRGAGVPPRAPDADREGDTNAGGQAQTARNPQVRAFFEALRTFGVDPQQFRKDFMTAIKNARGGEVEPGTALKSFPPGSSVDTTS